MTPDGPPTSPERSDLLFDLLCCECGKDIRLSRVIDANGKELAFYVDELGLEQTDFHFHVPG